MTEFCIGDVVKPNETNNSHKLKKECSDGYPKVVKISPSGIFLSVEFPNKKVMLFNKSVFVKVDNVKQEHVAIQSTHSSDQREKDFWRLSVREFRTKYNQKV